MRTYRDWVLLAQTGDAGERNAAFDQLTRDFQGMVYRVAYSRLRDAQLAEDVTQEALLIAYKRIAQLQDVGAFPAWLKRIALTTVDRINRRASPPTESIDGQDKLAAAEPSPEAQLEDKELRGRVRQAVAALPERERAVTRDYYLKGESQHEISERLNIPLATVKKRLQYARAHLRGLLSGFHETLDRAMYSGEAQQFQPVYIYRREKLRRRRSDTERY